MNQDVFEFVVFLINETAIKHHKTTSEVYRIMSQSGCIDDYLVQFYEVLHTMGAQALVNDIEGFLQVRGLSI